MMTYRVGACATPSAGKAMAEYYLAGTLKTQQTGAAAYYTGAATKEDRAGDFWRGAIEGHLAEGGTVAELRPDLWRPSPPGSASPIPAGRWPKPVLRIY